LLSDPAVQLKINQGVLPKDRPRPANGAGATYTAGATYSTNNTDASRRQEQPKGSLSHGRLLHSSSEYLVRTKAMAARTPSKRAG